MMDTYPDFSKQGAGSSQNSKWFFCSSLGSSDGISKGHTHDFQAIWAKPFSKSVRFTCCSNALLLWMLYSQIMIFYISKYILLWCNNPNEGFYLAPTNAARPFIAKYKLWEEISCQIACESYSSDSHAWSRQHHANSNSTEASLWFCYSFPSTLLWQNKLVLTSIADRLFYLGALTAIR